MLDKTNIYRIVTYIKLYVFIQNIVNICTEIDNEDCLVLVKNKRQEIDLIRLEERFRKTASYDISEDKVIQNWEYFVKLLLKEGLYRGK